ncbi:probable SCO1-involved in stabilization of Cox1p and Cox2p [Ustilago bromivora]|uniref:Probable SCO1 - involved in stabilization of Cox1p and Cox2p n=1 Tax=Ustilago bromivora TaxID=307758 RepID=A0A1K0HMH5_9BASI|nr:probable SCO1-involved in stabilization of Cox1p and Cox2p [Ustilago bromivora]SYW77981.1 probable SCO1 - involved in stabilization of Cox1p and Cox2p [Ustilago bromivora]
MNAMSATMRVSSAMLRQQQLGSRRSLSHLSRSAARPTTDIVAVTPLLKRRTYASSSQNEESAKDKLAIGPFNLKAGLLFLATGAGLLYYFRTEKHKVEQRRKAETASAKVGRPRIGGPFNLITSTSHPFTHEDLLGSFSLVYFGFTNCPDICPEELDKMGEVVDRIDKKYGKKVINPVFISCDPARDTVPQLARYIEDFHPRMVGLTGTFDAVKQACKAYRVYFSTPPGADPMGDYLVDHSIFFYLMDPEGKFVDAFGRSVNAQETGDKVDAYVKQWFDAGLEIKNADARERVQKDGRKKAAL